jgi:hypothetical protein
MMPKGAGRVGRAGRGAEGRLWDIDTYHELMCTGPQKVADAVLGVVST